MHTSQITQVNKSQAFSIVVGENQVGQRIDNFLTTKLKGLPRSLIYRILRSGEVRVNKKRVKPGYRLQEGDVLRIPPLQLAPERSPVKLDHRVQKSLLKRILYEDNNLFIINKPSGIAVHGGSGLSYGVIETLRQAWPQQRYLELVHRLDKETSGCLLIAKKPSYLKELHVLLRNGKVHKSYLALVQGHWDNAVKRVDVPLQKNQLRSGERIVTATSEGKASVTLFHIVQRFESTTLVEAKPQTGRTHQIRVHASYSGHPIVGDEKYCGDKAFNKFMRERGCKRLFLHASKISFTDPHSGQTISAEAELDLDLTTCLKQLN